MGSHNVYSPNVPVLCFLFSLMMAQWAETCGRIFNFLILITNIYCVIDEINLSYFVVIYFTCQLPIFSEKFELVLWLWHKVHTPSKWWRKTVFLWMIIYFRPSTKNAYVKWHGCLTSVINWSPGERRRAWQPWNHAAS